jgi:signal-transduction protein with cAMP-binding, CBS, and nucleotidyltransferase domain
MRKALMMFGTLNDTDIDWLTRVGELRRFSARQPIISERQPIEALFIILDGRAVVSVRGTEVARAAAGEILGEVSLVDSRLPTASVVPESETTVLQIGRSALKRKLREDMGFGCRFYHALAIVLAQRLQRNTPSGPQGRVEDSDDVDLADDVEADLLENVTLAGLRFDQLLRRTMKNG